MDKMKLRADDVRVAYPLFQEEGGGSIPTSALQLKVGKYDSESAFRLNRKWHSRLPEMGNWRVCDWYAAEYDGIIYSVAAWGSPIATKLNGRNWLELRRFAIAPDSPPNTASRVLGVMVRLIKKDRPEIVKLISYQDTAVHSGTIYRASGWNPVECYQAGNNWNNKRVGDISAQSGPLGLKVATLKIRWEKNIR